MNQLYNKSNNLVYGTKYWNMVYIIKGSLAIPLKYNLLRNLYDWLGLNNLFLLA